jgi:hypothetical protein
VAGGLDSLRLYIFDLRAIRAGLSPLGLDWDVPPFPENPRGAEAPPQFERPLAIDCDLGDLQKRPEPMP